MGATIKDIAKIAGVSKSTVSRVLSNNGKYSNQAKEKVLKVAKELNYQPNEIAKAMVTRKTGNIAFVIYHKIKPVITYPFFTPIISSLIETATNNNYGVFVFTERDINDPFKTIHEKRVDGVILASRINAEIVEAFKSQNIPVMLLNPFVEIENTSYVESDEYSGSMDAMQYLFQKGHRRIGFVQGFWKERYINDRYSAYKDALMQKGIEFDENLVIEVDEVSMETGRNAADAFMRLSELPSAIFAASDLLAIGMMKQFKKSGFSIPKDIAIVGFDDIEMASIYEPALTTVRVNKELMGELAVRQLILMMNMDEDQSQCKKQITLPTSLVVRDST
ncbi:LacI family DNA-binding transcriptional regulator [Aeromicrobium ponti]|uniref:LacI family transcriptional regulator n=1 Tax=Cytobacillus oceanisediminis TaxID=665099 RepID=A0A562J4G3_9BACI|nr:LacI family DNA-binding transcriptional regulator [Cytobacillus oceanisediminis]TWH78027.1 LacI family transcriptional regulator [Cytobacillus oceanisediminis]